MSFYFPPRKHGFIICLRQEHVSILHLLRELMIHGSRRSWVSSIPWSRGYTQTIKLDWCIWTAPYIEMLMMKHPCYKHTIHLSPKIALCNLYKTQFEFNVPLVLKQIKFVSNYSSSNLSRDHSNQTSASANLNQIA